jgi:hypothetical protein
VFQHGYQQPYMVPEGGAGGPDHAVPSIIRNTPPKPLPPPPPPNPHPTHTQPGQGVEEIGLRVKEATEQLVGNVEGAASAAADRAEHAGRGEVGARG